MGPRVGQPLAAIDRGRTQALDAALLALAYARPQLAWPRGRDIAHARNAHFTNSPEQLRAALAGDYDWFEADIRLDERGIPVTRHEVGDPEFFELKRWLRITVPSGRGIKLDIKEPQALPAVIAEVQRASVPEHRLIMNVGIWSVAELMSVRRAFPRAIINISPVSDADLSATDIARMQVAAMIIGGPVMFPLRHDLVTPHAVHALRPYGRVAVWNQPQLTRPRPTTELELRAMGVDGMIDLRRPQGTRDHLSVALVAAGAALLGWNAVYDVLDAVGLLPGPSEDDA